MLATFDPQKVSESSNKCILNISVRCAQVSLSFTESTCRVLTGTAPAPFVTSRKSCPTHSTTSFVKIESRSIVPSVRKCTFLKEPIDLMEPTSVLRWPTSSSKLTTRALCCHQKFTSMSPSFSASISPESVDQSTLSPSIERSLILALANSA